MTRLRPHRPHPVLTGADLVVCSSYLPLEQIARREHLDPERLAGWIDTGHLPRPAYSLPDGTPVFPPDLLDLVRSAGGLDTLPPPLRPADRARGPAAGRRRQHPRGRVEDYLSGEYGICLRQVTPETLVLKEALVERIDRALAASRPDELRWRRALAFEIDGLDALVQPFARIDRVRFGRPTSRERLDRGAPPALGVAPRATRRGCARVGGLIFPPCYRPPRARASRNAPSVRTPMPVAPLPW